MFRNRNVSLSLSFEVDKNWWMIHLFVNRQENSGAKSFRYFVSVKRSTALEIKRRVIITRDRSGGEERGGWTRKEVDRQ